MTRYDLLNQITQKVLTLTGKGLQPLQAKNRSTRHIYARKFFVALARLNEFSYSEIGEYLKRDHTTIINLARKAEADDTLMEIAKSIVLDKGKGPVGSRLTESPYKKTYEKYQGKCAVCGFDDVVEIHHILPRRVGGTDALENLILLCPNHHAMIDKGMLFIKDINIPKSNPQY